MSNLIGPGGKPIEPTLSTVAQIKHCGGCHHAVLLPGQDGRIDVNLLTCLESPPVVVIAPVLQPGPQIQVPGLSGATMPGPPVMVGYQEVSKYPTVGRKMRACSKFEPRTEDDKVVEQLDIANAESGQSLNAQQKN